MSDFSSSMKPSVFDRLNLSSVLLRTAFLSTLLLTACATQAPSIAPRPHIEPPRPEPIHPVTTLEETTLRTLMALQDRLDRVAGPLLVNNPQLCKGRARNLLGFTAKNKYSYSEEYIDAAQKVAGLDERLQVTGVLTASGAAKAGLQRGDGLVLMENTALPQGPNAERLAATVLAPLLNGKTSVKLTVLRHDSNIELEVPLTSACAFGIDLGNADIVNAYDDGMRVMVTRGMVSFVSSDEELAYVLAREIAHNALRHATKQRLNATVGGIIDNLIRMHPDMSGMEGTAGIKIMPPELDLAADRLALYMLARAGYALDHAIPFWQRLAAKYPATVMNSYTVIHPITPTRISAMEKTIQEIKAKQAGNQPLLP